jgi:hypothetical protein
MPLHISDLGIFPDVKGMQAVVPGVQAARVMDSAAGHDINVAVLPDKKVVVYQIAQTRFGDDDGNVDRLFLVPA